MTGGVCFYIVYKVMLSVRNAGMNSHIPVITYHRRHSVMEKRDLELIEKYSPVDEELRRQIEDHRRYEEILENLSKRA